MIDQLMCYTFKFHYVPAEKKQDRGLFSRLTREIREAEHFEVCDSVLADHKLIKKIKKIRTSKKAIQEDDPWVEHLGIVAMTDQDYVNMIHNIESGTDFKNVDKECELAKFHNFQNNLSVITLKGGESLILKDNCEILVPKNKSGKTF